MSTLLLPKSHLVFKKGAVLRYSELNGVVDYMKREIRASRMHLDGVGIVEGLKVSCVKSSDNKITTINISAGQAVTTDGQMIDMAECSFTLMKEVTDTTLIGKISKYYDIPSNKPDKKYLELIPPPVLLGELPISGSKAMEIEEDGCVFFMLEEKAITTPCFPETDKNEDKEIKIRFFLGKPKLKTTQVSTDKSICFASPCLPCFSGEDLVKINSPETFRQVFENKIAVGVTAIGNAYTMASTCFPHLFCEPFGNFTDNLKQIPVFNAYNYLQTLVSAYHEFISLRYFKTDRYEYAYLTGQGMMSLGPCEGNTCTKEAPPCRHEWECAITCIEGFEEARFYAQRMVELSKPGNLDFSAPPTAALTPSRSDMAPLSKRAIPFYLKPEVFRPLWSYQDTQQKTTSTIPYRSDAGCYMEGCDFVRVEGHIGKTLSELLAQALDADKDLIGSTLHNLRRNQNLPFQIKLCALNEDSQLGNRGIVPFANYLAQHPGLKPMGGVPKGGTFLLVVAPGVGIDAQPTIVGDFCLPYFDWYKEPRILKLVAEFIVEAPNDFELSENANHEFTYLFNVESMDTDASPVNILFKSVSENADIFEWHVFEENQLPAPGATPQGILPALFYTEFNPNLTYKVRLTAKNADGVSETVTKTIKFRPKPVQVEEIIAEFIVEAPNDFTIEKGGRYVFDVKQGTDEVRVFFKNISEHANKYTWQVDNVSPGTTTTALSFEHLFSIPKLGSPPIIHRVKLTAENTAQPGQTAVSVEKTIQFKVIPEQPEKLIAEYIVEAPNDFVIDDKEYIFDVKEGVESVHIFFKSVSENADTFEWLLSNDEDPAIAKGSQPAFDSDLFDPTQTYKLTLTVSNTAQAGKAVIEKSIQFNRLPFTVERVIAQFIVEAPNDFELTEEGNLDIYTFRLTNQPGAQEANLHIFFKSTSENATTFRWLVDGDNANTDNKASDFDHTFRFVQINKEEFKVTLIVNPGTSTERQIVKSVRAQFPNFAAAKPAAMVSDKATIKVATRESATTPTGNVVNQLRARHKQYRAEMGDLGKANALLAKTAGYKNAVAFLDSGDDLGQLEKLFKDLSLQFIRNVKLEGGVPNEVYQTVLKNLIFFCFDKLSFLQKEGLSVQFRETFNDVFGRLKSENTFPDLSSLKEVWKSDDIETQENSSVIHQLNTFFT